MIKSILEIIIADMLESYGILYPYNYIFAIILVGTFIYLLKKEGPGIIECIRTEVTNYIKKSSEGYCIMCQ